MALRNNVSSIWVFDQDEALRFYTEVLGLELSQDMMFGTMRWLSVKAPGDRKMVLLEKPEPPRFDAETVEQLRTLVAQGAGGGWLAFATDDLEGLHARVVAAGVELTQPITQQPYGRDFAFADPWGNPIRVGEIPEQTF